MARAVSPGKTGVSIRFASADDCGLILQFIRELALYEKAPVAVVATEAQLRRHGFGAQPQFEAIIASLDGEPAGMGLFHTRFSTWLGEPTLYLEDIFVREAARGHGVGRRLMALALDHAHCQASAVAFGEGLGEVGGVGLQAGHGVGDAFGEAEDVFGAEEEAGAGVAAAETAAGAAAPAIAGPPTPVCRRAG